MSSSEVLITGGAGFIGTNLAHRLLLSGRSVRIFDSLARQGVEENLEWLHGIHGGRVETWIADIRDRQSLKSGTGRGGAGLSLRGSGRGDDQPRRPRFRFRGECAGHTQPARGDPGAQRSSAAALYIHKQSLWRAYRPGASSGTIRATFPLDRNTEQFGISELRPFDFHSPYGCSKGAADQYVLDYSRIYGLPAVVFRMSCIYGPHQCGTEDQGWVAHFLTRVLDREADHALRRRHAGAGHPVHRRSGGCVPARLWITSTI